MSNYSDSEFSGDKNSSWFKTFSLIPDGAIVMDIGCSIGTFGKELILKKKCIVDGIEIDDKDYRTAKKKLRNVYKLNIETDDIPDSIQYDIVFMGDVIEHLAQPIPALNKIRKLLKPEGSLVFSIPNLTHMSVRLMLLNGKIEYGKTGLLDETHLHFYNQEEITRVLNQAGYKISSIDSVERDIPIDLLKKELSKLGLVMSDKFIKLAQSTNAATYQFVGAASVSDQRIITQELPKKSPINIMDKYVKELNEKYSKEIITIKSSLNRELEQEKEAHKETRIKLRDIANSKSFKVGRLLMKGPGVVKQKLSKTDDSIRLRRALKKYYDLDKKGFIRVVIIARSGNISPTSSAFLRLISPLTYGKAGRNISLEVVSGKTTDLDEGVDVCIVQRTAIDNIRNAKELVANLKTKNIKLILDTDDAFSQLDPSHPQYDIQVNLVEALGYIKRSADRVWVSTDRLEKDIKQKRVIYRNSVDSRLWKLQKKEILSNNKIKAVYMGTATHDEDFSMILSSLDRINKKYNNIIDLTIIGVASSLPKRTWLKVKTPVAEKRMYPYFVDWFTKLNNFDIGLAPLVDSEFNKAKSDIKVLDYLSIGVLPIVSDLEPYKNKELDELIERVGYGGDDWFNAFENLILKKNDYRKKKNSSTDKIHELITQTRSVGVISEKMYEEIKKLALSKNEQK